MKKKHPAIGILPRKIYGVMFQKKSEFQKDDCISNAYGGNCKRESTMEAVEGNAIVRCCTSPACKKLAAMIAMQPTILSGKEKTGKKAFLVGTHRHSFRAGKPAEIIGISFVTPKNCNPRPCFKICFGDGKIDDVPLSAVHQEHSHEIISGVDLALGKIPKVNR